MSSRLLGLGLYNKYEKCQLKEVIIISTRKSNTNSVCQILMYINWYCCKTLYHACEAHSNVTFLLCTLK